MTGRADLSVNSRLIASFHFIDKAGKAWAIERLRWIAKHDVLSVQDWEISLTIQARNDHAVRQWKTDRNNHTADPQTGGLQHLDQVCKIS
jgi:hypothetical protein